MFESQSWKSFYKHVEVKRRGGIRREREKEEEEEKERNNSNKRSFLFTYTIKDSV